MSERAADFDDDREALSRPKEAFPGAKVGLLGQRREPEPDVEPSILDAADEVLAEDTAGVPRLGALSRSAALRRIATRPPVWRVAGVLTSDDYGVLAGPKGVGKTFALLDLAVAVALGEPWFGRFETTRARVLVLTAEDSEARLWQRIDAIARAFGRELSDLEEWLYVHPLPFNAIADTLLFRAELEATMPGLVVMDPAYKYLAGAKAQLFDMGPLLTPLQVACWGVGASLLVGHHYNRREGAQREERISGAGLLEWARVVITAEAKPRRDDNPAVDVSLEITGNSIDPVTLNVRRTVVSLDESANPEISYAVELTAEGAAARETNRPRTALERVRAVLGKGETNAMSVKQLGDAVAADGSRNGLKVDTIRRVLNRDLKEEVDSLDHPGSESLWWLV